ncbi:Site-specific recombinase XerD [Algoriella xinjiangensis]|uniref:Site-specific recombinase XerD n=2 Tax=Algoriella xinjiangensis TaxID=684065 RepID=A0A1I4WI33_9FLAO|nr:Site-specific recombinase XerD [Algoriella xinjiangensis]VDH16927.1 Tyrosine recombinase XerC [Algoriella xinjiangensis]
MFYLANYQFSFGVHRNRNIIFIRFPKNQELITDLKNYTKYVKYSSTYKMWYTPYSTYFCNLFQLPIQNYQGKQLLQYIDAINQEQLTLYIQELRLRAYSENTIRTYTIEFAQLLYFIKDEPIENVTPQQLRSYLLYCFKVLGISENQMHSRLNALKFYFEKVLKQPSFFFDIPRPKKPSKLPKILSQQDVIKLFEVTDNLKHLMILKLCYGLGLRVSEIVNIKITDIDSKTMMVHIQAAKGKKDRYVPLPNSILDELREYYSTYKPQLYLFEGIYNSAYAIRSAQAVFKNALKKAKINKPIGIHGLRHSYATHLLEYGTDMSFIQKLLGHNNIKTTQIYAKITNTFLSKVISPLDELNSKK